MIATATADALAWMLNQLPAVTLYWRGRELRALRQRLDFAALATDPRTVGRYRCSFLALSDADLQEPALGEAIAFDDRQRRISLVVLQVEPLGNGSAWRIHAGEEF